VKVTDKKGNSVIYNSIEEAAEKSGLSIQALKLRANKNSVPKDGISVEWMDEHTKRSYKSRQSKRKGNSYELQIIKELTSLGYDGLKSSRSESKLLDNMKIDIADTENVLDFYVQCKRTLNTPNVEGIMNDCPLKDKPMAVFWHKEGASNYKEFVIIPKEYFYKLISK
jgi:hypothetical protein